MMKNFTQKMILCVGMLALFSSISSAQTYLVINSPASAAGEYEVTRGTSADVTTLTVTGDLQMGNDGTGVSMTDGCEALDAATGKIIVVDRGNCPFTDKLANAEATGAIAALVCNTEAGVITVMATPDVTIPTYMATFPDCEVIKVAMAAGTLNATIEFRAEVCDRTYDDIVFWGNTPGEGDFSNGLGDWTTINLEPLGSDEIVWVAKGDRLPESPNYFGSATPIESPTGCTGMASFSAVKYTLLVANPPVQPYPNFSAELISPSIDCTGKDSIVLEFFTLYNNLNNDGSGVSVSSDGGATWVSLGTMATLLGTEDLITQRVRVPVPQFDNKADCKIKFTAAQDFYYFEIDDVTLRSGTYRDVRANAFFSGAQNYYGPANQPSEIPFLIDVQNLGNSTVNISAKAEVLNGSNVLFSQSQDFGAVVAGATYENSPFAQTFTAPAEAGTYTVRYTVSSDVGDDETTNNVQETTFILEEDGTTMSKIPLNYAGLGRWGIPGNHNRSYGAYYKFPNSKHANGNLISIDTISAGVTQDEATPSIEGFLIAEIFVWDDLNGDQNVDPDERTIIGQGSQVITSANAGIVAIAVADVNDDEAKVVLDIKDGDAIIAMIHQNSLNSGVTWRTTAISTGDTYSTTATDLAFDTLGRVNPTLLPNFCGFDATGSSPDDIDSRIYARSGQLTYYVPLRLGKVLGVNDFDASIEFGIFPNPTADYLNIDLTFEKKEDYASISILDNSGKFIRGMKFDNVTTRSTTMDVSALTSGVYTLKVQTPNGFSTKQFVIQK